MAYRYTPRHTVSALIGLCIFSQHALSEVADKLQTVEELRMTSIVLSCAFGIVTFSVMNWGRWPWLSIVFPGLSVLVALEPAIESDIAVFALKELGADYLKQVEHARWFVPVVATMGLVLGMVVRRWRMLKPLD